VDETLSAALLEIEDARGWDPHAELARALRIEADARLVGDPLLINRALLCQANMRLRSGDIPGAVEQMWRVQEWAEANDAQVLLARTHLIWAAIHQHLGDSERSLEHALLSVELLDDESTTHMHIWHRTKLADALWSAGSMEAARVRYAQAEELAGLSDPSVLQCVLNNHAYAEYDTGNQQRAEDVASRLQQISADQGVPLDPAYLDTIGAIQIGNGRFAEAAATMRLCLEWHHAGSEDDADALPEYLLTLAQAQRGLEAYSEAQASLDQCRALCVERDLVDVLVRVHQEQAELHAARGEFAEAFAVHKVFFAAHQNLHSLQREARTRARQAMFETVEARQEAERFREQARRDPLTGLHNRRHVDESLPMLIESDPSLTIALVDLDHFKQINDRLSHNIGDEVLIEVASILADGAAAGCPGGYTARLGGEEFLIVLPGTSRRRAVSLLEDIRRRVREHDWHSLTGDLPVTVSIGVATCAEVAAPTQPTLLSTADTRLYAAKHAGRDRVVAANARGYASAA
jgi:diguanylate cyclase (GGDEF)-like protein